LEAGAFERRYWQETVVGAGTEAADEVGAAGDDTHSVGPLTKRKMKSRTPLELRLESTVASVPVGKSLCTAAEVIGKGPLAATAL
jgi:hypothetical protein